MPPAARGLFSRKRETCPLDPRKSFLLLNKSFVGGPGGRFFKRAPLAAGGKKTLNFSSLCVKLLT
jgi:hypothetical protein